MAIATSPVFLISDADSADRFRKLLRAGGGAYSTVTADYFAKPDASLAPLRAAAPEQAIVIAYVPMVGAAWNDWLAAAAAMAHVVIVVVSDNPEVIDTARRHGLAALAPDIGLSPSGLDTFIDIALTVHTLKKRQTHLQQLYDLAEQRFHDMADQFADWLWEVDTAGVLTFSSSRKRPVAGATKGTLFTSCFLPDEKLRIEDDFAELARNPAPFHDRDYWAADTYGTRFCWSVSGTPVFDHAQRLIGFRGVARDISPLKATTDQLYDLVNNDTLTGVVNRNRCYDELARTVRIAKRENRTGVLLVLDIDRFGTINQAHGHLVGDKLLIHVAQVLKDSIRTGDLVARLDGDQFALILRDLRPDDLPHRVERLQSTLAARPLQTEKGSIILSLSGGAALYPADGTDADQLLAHAGDALTQAKGRGPGHILRYDAAHSTSAQASGQLEWMALLTDALKDPERHLALHYQPIVPIAGTLDGEFFEALVRLQMDDGTLVPATRFIGMAEEFGLVAKLDKAVALRAIKALQHYHSHGRPMHVSVNLSSKSFEEDGLFDELAALLAEAGLPKGSLVFEMTETALLTDLPRVKAIMSKLKKAGAGFALDDCGVGYSSLNYIRHLELDYIKIDGTFIRNLHNSADDQAFVKALADLARQKGIATVAEMVEHEAAVAVLQKLGIDFGQGFHFAPPAAELPPKKSGRAGRATHADA